MSRKKQRRYNLRMSEREEEIINQKIKKSGMTKQDFLVGAALEKVVINKQDMKDTLLQLNWTEELLEQLVRACNMGQEPTMDRILEMKKEVSVTCQMLRSLAQKPLLKEEKNAADEN